MAVPIVRSTTSPKRPISSAFFLRLTCVAILLLLNASFCLGQQDVDQEAKQQADPKPAAEIAEQDQVHTWTDTTG